MNINSITYNMNQNNCKSRQNCNLSFNALRIQKEMLTLHPDTHSILKKAAVDFSESIKAIEEKGYDICSKASEDGKDLIFYLSLKGSDEKAERIGETIPYTFVYCILNDAKRNLAEFIIYAKRICGADKLGKA